MFKATLMLKEHNLLMMLSRLIMWLHLLSKSTPVICIHICLISFIFHVFANEIVLFDGHSWQLDLGTQ